MTLFDIKQSEEVNQKLIDRNKSKTTKIAPGNKNDVNK